MRTTLDIDDEVLRAAKEIARRRHSTAGAVISELARLAEAAATHWHEFWTDDVSLPDPDIADWRQVLGSRQLTDAYLLARAVRRGGRLATLDRAAPLAAVPGAAERHLVCL